MTALAPAAHPDAKFWDRIADKYARSKISDEAAYEKKLELTRALFTPDTTALELGCGTGSTAITHAPFVKRMVATDLSGRMIDIATDKDGADQVEFRQASFEDIVADGVEHDVVLALSLIHLLPDPQDAIHKIWSMVKPGGAFVSSTACLRDMNPLIRLILPVGHALGFFPKVQVFTGDHLVEMMQNAGFTIERDWRPGKAKAVFVIARKPLGA